MCSEQTAQMKKDLSISLKSSSAPKTHLNLKKEIEKIIDDFTLTATSCERVRDLNDTDQIEANYQRLLNAKKKAVQDIFILF